MQQTRKRDIFTTIRTEGGLLPADLLERIAAGGPGLDGLDQVSFHLAPGEKISEAISRAWNRLLGYWETFRASVEKLPTNDSGTGLTRDRWMLPLFQELGYGRLQRAEAVFIADKGYPVSHLWGRVPIHLVGFRVPLDRRSQGVAGAAQTAPHGVVQELLNASDDYLWAFVSNGRRLRLLRDNKALTRQSYVEFDLEAMFEGEVYPDFTLLWLLCHQSRVEAERPSEFWLEKWSQAAQREGIRALDALREGVEQAIVAFGSGFISHPANRDLREKLKAQGGLSAQDYYRQLLRLVYRLLFLFVAEDRDLLLLPDADPVARERYLRFYATTRLRHLSEKQRGTRHGDLWAGLSQVLGHLYSGYPALALPALGSFLFRADAITNLAGCELANHALLDAMRALCQLRDGNVTRSVSFKNLQTEELGSVYEALLELHPEMNVDAGTFVLKTAAGNERKTTGHYSTPDELVQCLLDSTLDPVLDEAVKRTDVSPSEAILSLTVCDPACGAGHFLIGAAHRMAKRLASVETGEDEPSPEATRIALRKVIGKCLYGVDINPMAVELCKVALWMEALVPGKALSFLDQHIRCGNALLGVRERSLVEEGIPSSAFDPIQGDSRELCTQYKKRNRDEQVAYLKDETARQGGQVTEKNFAAHSDAHSVLKNAPDDELNQVEEKERELRRIEESEEAQQIATVAGAWCTTFVWKKQPGAIPPATDALLRRLNSSNYKPEPDFLNEVHLLSDQYQFFHWHQMFSDVFTKGNDGFSVVLGNPPWERVKLQEKEWFAARRPEIANAPNAAVRKRMIAALENEDPALYAAFQEDQRRAEGESALLRNSGLYPLCGRGDVNTYAVFAELFRSLLSTSQQGRAGIIVPSGIATDDTTKYFFQDINERHSLASLFDFENRKGLFPAVDSRMKFCTLTMTAQGAAKGDATFIFFAHSTDDLRDPERRFTLSAEDIALLNPNTRTCPIFRTRRDAEITKGVHRCVPVLVAEGQDDGNSWGVEFLRMLDMSNDSDLFKQKHELADAMPLYEAKMLGLYDHRAADVIISQTAMVRQGQPEDLTATDKADPNRLPQPRSWVERTVVDERLVRRDRDGNIVWEWKRDWLFGWRDITSATNERTVIASLLPRTGVGNNFPLALPAHDSAILTACLSANLSAFIFDFFARQNVGGTHLNFFIVEQLPVLPPEEYVHAAPWDIKSGSIAAWLATRVLELTYTAYDMIPFARDCGYEGEPFRWDEDRRFLLRCELDAAYFHLYGINRDDVDYIMNTFPIVRRKDEAAYSEYRSKRVILEIYDKMAVGNYETCLSLPPSNGWTPPAHLLPATSNVETMPTAPTEPEPSTPPVPADTPDEFELPTRKAPMPKANVFFQRTVLGAEIVSRMHQQRSFGHVKFMKTFEICELDADLGDLETQYYRQAAGPLDRKLLFSLDQQMERQKWFKAERQEGRVVYVPLEKAGQHQEYFERYWGGKRDALHRIIRLFAPLNTRQSEIVATLYTAWNDLLLAGEQPDDTNIIRESRDQWHEAKQKITPDEWAWGLQWMRQNQLLPRGTGRATRTMPISKHKSSARTKRKVVTPTKNAKPAEASALDPIPAATVPPKPADDFELVPPETKKQKSSPQPQLDLPAVPQPPRISGLPQPLMRVRLNGQAATVYAIEPAGEATSYTVVLDGERAPRKVYVPPARIERLEP
jgi:hypothetical protein